MTSKLVGKSAIPSFDRSINGVDDADQHQINLPASASLRPVTDPFTVPHTEALLKPESVHTRVLAHWLSPGTTDARLTQPDAFSLILKNASKKLNRITHIPTTEKGKVVKLLARYENHRDFVYQQLARILGA